MSVERAPAQGGSWTRRGWLSAATIGLTGTALRGSGATSNNDERSKGEQPADRTPPLPLSEFQPKSMLHVEETRVPRARFPAIDFHTHVSPRARSPRRTVPPADLVPVMDAVN